MQSTLIDLFNLYKIDKQLWKKIPKMPNFIISQSMFFIQGIFDIYHLRKIIPQLKQVDTIYTKNLQQLKPFYQEYVNSISLDYMAISLQLASFILSCLEIIQPNRIADFGSGFSSFVFRYYKKHYQPSVRIWTIDHNQEWLNKTKKYLKKHNLSVKQTYIYQKFKKLKLPKFDFLLYDLGLMDLRPKYLSLIPKLLDDHGMAIVDDIHFCDYRKKIDKMLIKSNLRLQIFSLHKYTFDKYTRFAGLIYKI